VGLGHLFSADTWRTLTTERMSSVQNREHRARVQRAQCNLGKQLEGSDMRVEDEVEPEWIVLLCHRSGQPGGGGVLLETLGLDCPFFTS
jgi:hypothetical protein